MKYELWYSAGEHAYTMFPEDHSQKKLLLEKYAKLQAVFEAETWEDARRQQHEFLEWEPYVPMDQGASIE